jgi:hypothetical protein
MKKIVWIFALISFISCKKEGVSTVNNGTEIWFKNAAGVNLLNSTEINAIRSADIDIFLLQNGAKVRVNRPMMDLNESFRITPTSQGDLMTLYFDIMPESMQQNRVTMFIRYQDGSEDKLMGEFNSDRSSAVYLEKVWVNDVLKWSPSPGKGSALVEIIK